MSNNLVAALAAVLILVATPAAAQTYTKNNGVISYDANMYGVPMISRLRILGTQVMPYDNAGAGFQMTGRSAAGNPRNLARPRSGLSQLAPRSTDGYRVIG